MYTLPSPAKITAKYPLPSSIAATISSYREDIANLLRPDEERLAFIVGPCSIHNIEATLEYAKKLVYLSRQLAPTFLIAMRVYLEKPRTVTGWKGYICDPYLDSSFNTEDGITNARKLLLHIAEMGLPIATEFLDPHLLQYYQDTISWGFIGARTCTSSIHRQIASRLQMPIGFKNPTSGDVNDAIQAILSSYHSHHYVSTNANSEIMCGLSPGNPNCHVVLRGADSETNYGAHKVFDAWKKQATLGIQKRILVDCSHGNSLKDFKNQPAVFTQVLEDYKNKKTPLLGMMLESYLKEGSQSISSQKEKTQPDISVTDSCIGWEKTQDLLESALEALSIHCSN